MWLLNDAELPMILSSTCHRAELVAFVQTIHAWVGVPGIFFRGGGLGLGVDERKMPHLTYVYSVGPDCISQHFSFRMHYVRNGQMMLSGASVWSLICLM